MSGTDDLVVAYIEVLHRHRKLVAAAYHEGQLEESGEAATPRGIQDADSRVTVARMA